MVCEDSDRLLGFLADTPKAGSSVGWTLGTKEGPQRGAAHGLELPLFAAARHDEVVCRASYRNHRLRGGSASQVTDAERLRQGLDRLPSTEVPEGGTRTVPVLRSGSTDAWFEDGWI